MTTDRNLLFGVLALQADLITEERFIEACTVWAAKKDKPLAELLIERAWIREADREHLDYLLERKLEKSREKPLGALSPNVQQSLAGIDDPDIQRSLGGDSADSSTEIKTVDSSDQTQGRYERMDLHQTGGIGRVWLAKDHDLERIVALKELLPERAGNPASVQRFIQEAQVTGQLEHPGIVPVYELSELSDTDQPFYTMRFVKGQTLSQAASAYHAQREQGCAESLGLVTLLNAFVTVCNTIAYAHSRGVLHRDIKGQNVVLGAFGEVVVLDWGLAKTIEKETEQEEEEMATDPGLSTGEDLTVQGQTLGTPGYMAPEQASGQLDRISEKTDVYGLGALLYEILTGRPPFSGSSTREILEKVRREQPASPQQHWADAPSDLVAICFQALSKEPEQRQSSASQMALEVQGWQEAQRLKAQEALRQSEALYHSLVETLPLCVWRKDLNGIFTFANHQLCDHLNVLMEDLLGRSDFQFFPEDLARKYQEDDARVVQTGTSFEAVEEHHTHEAKKMYVQVVKNPLFNTSGEVVGTQGIFWDVTDRRQAELERERFFRLSLDMMCIAGFNGYLLRLNPAWETTLGWSPKELLSCPYLDFVHPEDRDATREGAIRLTQGETTSSFTNRYRCKNGSYKKLLWMAVPYPEEQVLYATARDISDKP